MRVKKYTLIVLSILAMTHQSIYATDDECYMGGQKIYTFKTLNDTHEQFYCNVKVVEPHRDLNHLLQSEERVIFYNNAVIISGFDARGILKSKISELSKKKGYYFDGFYDTDVKHSIYVEENQHTARYPTFKAYVCAITPPTIKLQCKKGRGGRKERFPGQYG